MFHKSGFLLHLERNPQPGKGHFVRYRAVTSSIVPRDKLACMSRLPWKRQPPEFFLDLGAVGK
jgi:hypothetical protein